VTILADEVQNPSPEEDIDEFNDKKEEEVWNAHVHSSQLKGVHVTGEVLESNNDEADNRNQKVKESRGAQVFKSSWEHLYNSPRK
jgi:hypothetical protein